MMILWLFTLFFSPGGLASSDPGLLAPIFVEDRKVGEVWVYLDEPVAIEKQSFQRAMNDLLLPKPLEELESLPPKISLEELKKRAIQLEFDAAALILRARIDSSIRRVPEFRIRAFEQNQKNLVSPAPVSGYLNGTLQQGFEYPKASPRMPLRAQFDFVTNVQGFVLETGEVYTEKDSVPWRRSDTKVTRDFEEHVLRTSIGDLYPFTTGYQASRLMGGVSASRQFSIQPYLNTRPQNRTEIYLTRPTTIEVYVNDGFVQRIYANPGPLELRDFPLFSGVNKVDLKLIEDGGKIQWINLNLLYDVQLLGSGVHQFAYQGGFLSEPVRADRRYKTSEPFFSGFHRLGFTDTLTMGTNFQSDSRVWMAGLDSVVLTRGGVFSFEGALSKDPSLVTASVGKLRYRSLDYKLGNDRPIRGVLEVEYKSRWFSPPGARNENLFSYRTDVSLSKALSARDNVGLGFGWSKNRGLGADKKTGRFDWQSELAPQWRLATSYAVERESKLEHRFQLTLTWIDLAGKYFGNLTYDYPSKVQRLELSKNPSTEIDDYRAQVGVQNSPRNMRFDALAEYTKEVGILRLEHLSDHEKNPSKNSHRSTLLASSAVVFTHKNIAISRPVADSFVILETSRDYSNLKIPVNKRDDNPEAYVNPKGVIPTLSSYAISPVVLDTSEFPVGFSLENDHYWLRPTYKSGIFLNLGGKSKVLVKGIFVRAEKPVGYQVGEVFRDGTFISSFFTNKNGVFLLENLSAGNYELRLEGFGAKTFSIGEEQSGFLELPEMKLEEDQ